MTEHDPPSDPSPIDAVDSVARALPALRALTEALHLGRARDEHQVIDGRSNRPGLVGTLSRAADIILEAAQGYRAGLDDDVRMTDAHFVTEAIEQVRALMLAGWSAPTERTLAVRNGLVLREDEWRALAEFEDATVMLPGGERVLTLRTAASHPRSHFRPGSALYAELWERREAMDAVRGDLGDNSDRRVRGAEARVPTSFLRYLAELSRALHEHGDFAAANSLDSALAQVADVLVEHGIPWHDRGRDRLPDPGPAQKIRVGPTPTEEHVRTMLTKFTDEYPHLAHGWPRTTPGETYATSPERIEELEYRLARRDEDCQRVKDELMPFVAAHMISRSEVLTASPDTLKAGYVAERTAELLRWYADELTRVKREGTPGVVHEVDAAFHKLTVTERDHAWVESENRKKRIEELETELARVKGSIINAFVPPSSEETS